MYGENFTFVKYGDGEIICMIGGTGKTVMIIPTLKNLVNYSKSFC